MKMRSILPGRTSACRSSCRCVSSPQSNRKLLFPLRSAMDGDDLIQQSANSALARVLSMVPALPLPVQPAVKQEGALDLAQRYGGR